MRAGRVAQGPNSQPPSLLGRGRSGAVRFERKSLQATMCRAATSVAESEAIPISTTRAERHARYTGDYNDRDTRIPRLTSLLSTSSPAATTFA